MLLLGAARAEAVPSVTYECTPAPQDCSGWYRSNVSIDWTVLPSSLARLARLRTAVEGELRQATGRGRFEIVRAAEVAS